MSSSNFFVPQSENTQYPKVFSNNYFGNDESNLDEYDNIDCDLLLEFFGGETTPGPSRLGYENNSYNKQFNGENPSATGSTEQHSSMYDRESNSNVKPFAVVDIKKEKSIMNSTKSKKQRLGPDESQEQGMNSEMAPTQSNQEQFHYGNNDGSPAKGTVTAKSSTSKIIQLEASKDRRRERNKVLARKTRCKKKAEFETLRKQLLKLRTENDRLKELVKGTLPSPVITETLLGCDVQLPEDVAKVVQAMISAIERADPSLLMLVNPSQRSFCVTNAVATDNPIVYASPGFMELTGYDIHGILGHNCRLLQGKDTDRNEVRKLRVAIEQGREEQVVIKNYRKNGTSYWSRVQIAPMRDMNGRVTLIVSVQYEVPGPTTGMFLTAISDDMTGSHTSRDDTSNDGTSSNSGSSSSDGSQTSSSRSCASFADDRSGSYNGSTSGGSGSSSSGYSSNDNRSTDGVSDQGDSN